MSRKRRGQVSFYPIQQQPINPAQKAPTWDSVEDIYQSTARAIIDTVESFNSSVQILNAAGITSGELLTATVSIKRDLDTFVDDLTKIRSQHQTKRGIIHDGDELALSIDIYNDYVLLFDRFKSIVMEPMLIVTEHLAEIKFKSTAGQQPAETLVH